MDKNWNNQINNDDLIDGLDGCNLIDSSSSEDTSKKDGSIDIDFVEEQDISKTDETYTQVQDFEGEENSKEEKSCTQEEASEKEDDNSDEDEYLLLNRYKNKNDGQIPIQEEPVDQENAKKIEDVREQDKWGKDLGTEELGCDRGLDEFEIKKNSETEDKSNEDNSIEIKSGDEDNTTEIPIITPEAAASADNIKVEIEKPKDFNQLIDSNGEILENYISGNSKFDNISQTLEVCINLCELFAKIHSMGYCFNGITSKDIVVTPNKECFLLNDKKIVSPDDDTYQINYEITCAPEVLRNEARPSEDADKHSMAFLLFGLLFKSNPFEGVKVLNTPCYTKEEELKIYENPVFVYNTKDKSNTPVYGIHSVLIKYWSRVYPESIKMIFQQNFVAGVEDPEARSEDKSFIEIFIKIKEAIEQNNIKVKLTKNLKETSEEEYKKVKTNPKPEPTDTGKGFGENTIDIDKDKPKKPVDESLSKYKLYVTYSYIGMPNSDSQVFDLAPGTEIPNGLIGYEDVKSEKQVIGKVIQNSKHKEMLGIRNLSNHKWIAYKGSSKKEFPPGKVLVLADGVSIDFYPENQSANKTKCDVRKVKNINVK